MQIVQRVLSNLIVRKYYGVGRAWGEMMEPAAITLKVKEIIANITGIQQETIEDSAAFVDDLGLDSLAILEIVVDVEKAFKIRASDKELQSVRSIEDSVALILRHTCQEVA